MGEAMTPQQMFLGTMAGAVIVLSGALYALLFGLSRVSANRPMEIASFASFGLLAAAVYVLVDALALRGFWILITAVMLIGYFFLPRAIWMLCVGTHGDGTATTHSRAKP